MVQHTNPPPPKPKGVFRRFLILLLLCGGIGAMYAYHAYIGPGMAADTSALQSDIDQIRVQLAKAPKQPVNTDVSPFISRLEILEKKLETSGMSDGGTVSQEWQSRLEALNTSLEEKIDASFKKVRDSGSDSKGNKMIYGLLSYQHLSLLEQKLLMGTPYSDDLKIFAIVSKRAGIALPSQQEDLLIRYQQGSPITGIQASASLRRVADTLADVKANAQNAPQQQGWQSLLAKVMTVRSKKENDPVRDTALRAIDEALVLAESNDLDRALAAVERLPIEYLERPEVVSWRNSIRDYLSVISTLRQLRHETLQHLLTQANGNKEPDLDTNETTNELLVVE